MSETLHPRIDLAAELHKIAQRQHLNDVHHLVQLVRHALRHSPARIDIASGRTFLALSQDGDPFSLEERDLLMTVVAGDDVLCQQDALGTLERTTGAAVLALILRFVRVEIESDGWALLSSPAGVACAASPPRRGYRVRIMRRALRRGREREELMFFCHGASVPIRYNGQPINRPMEARGILAVRSRDADGEGMLAIPSKGRLSALSYCKQGVRFGFRRLLDPEGFVYEGFWDSHASAFEPTFSTSIRRAEEFLAAARRSLYDAVAAEFPRLRGAHRERVRQLLLASPPLARWDHVALFDAIGRPFALSLRDLVELEGHHGAIPCALRPSRRLPPSLPLLSLAQIHALQANGHAVMVIPAHGPRPGGRVLFR